VIGIGGSALGPQFIDRALAQQGQGLKLHFLDNTDPEGFEWVLAELGEELSQTLCLVISKSGGTQETRNAMLVTQHVFRGAGLSFGKQAVAITSTGSKLDQLAEQEGWYARLPMWDWVGGRTSVFSAVGLLPAALLGVNLEELLAGARLMDQQGRERELSRNPTAQLALNWWYAGNGRGEKAMAVLPYKDRLSLFSSYLQQLVMESLGKESDLEGRIVRQGLTVYGNKGSTDQHAYVQQLREGRNDFFAQFLEVLKDQKGPAVEIDSGATSGDYLLGFLLGTRQALREKQRQSITLTLDSITPRSIGALIALFERAVGIYAHLVGINAYHQPGVEAGKKAAGAVLQLQNSLMNALNDQPDRAWTVDELSQYLQVGEQRVIIFKVLEHLAANERVNRHQAAHIFSNRYQAKNT
jgi:glucose-6-phosphate isomerase